jgi:CubicO group peptidase (beta-lactamase class C family)
MKLLIRLLFVALLLVIVAGLFSSCKNTVNSPESPPDATQLQSALNAAGQLPYVHSMLVAEHGTIVAERYYDGYTQATPQDVRSVSKSFLSALTGIAVSDSLLNLDQRAADYFPEYQSSIVDSRVNAVTVRQLLTMRSGFDIDENIYATVFNSSNWIRTTLSLMLVSDPGSAFHYSTPAVHLLGGILNKVTEQNLLQFADTTLFNPVGITIASWPTDPQGNYAGGNFMSFTPRALVQFGILYLNGGVLNGKQIVPAAWVQSSLTNTTGSSSGSWGDLNNYGYGYLWWLGTVKGFDVFFALGFGGQYVLCIPALEMVVVTTAEYNLDYATADDHERAILHVIHDCVIPPVSQ